MTNFLGGKGRLGVVALTSLSITLSRNQYTSTPYVLLWHGLMNNWCVNVRESETQHYFDMY